jgi:hypothetical protein
MGAVDGIGDNLDGVCPIKSGFPLSSAELGAYAHSQLSHSILTDLREPVHIYWVDPMGYASCLNIMAGLTMDRRDS